MQQEGVFLNHNFHSLMILFRRDDNDDINDVATMGGVNLSEESKNILATNSELIGSQIRSCKDEAFLPHSALMSRITAIGEKQYHSYHLGYKRKNKK